MGGSRLSIVSLIIFFSLGAVLLWFVNEKEGIAIAEAEEAILIANDVT
jgi:UMF1 family MFS transporter